MPGGRGYVLVYNPNHPRSNNKGYVYEHYLVAEQILNRPLKKGETVHHKDQNKKNNSIDNIMIFASSSDHTAFHNGSEIYVEDGVWHAKLRTRLKNGKRLSSAPNVIKRCAYCGKEFEYYETELTEKRKYCSSKCYGAANRKLPNLTKIQNELKEANGNFSKVAKKYGVDSVSIHCMLRRAGLPCHSKDYKN